MPHVFNSEKCKFEQVHAFKVPIRPSSSIHKRTRNGEYCKYLRELEAEAQKKAAPEKWAAGAKASAARKAALLKATEERAAVVAAEKRALLRAAEEECAADQKVAEQAAAAEKAAVEKDRKAVAAAAAVEKAAADKAAAERKAAEALAAAENAVSEKAAVERAAAKEAAAEQAAAEKIVAERLAEEKAAAEKKAAKVAAAEKAAAEKAAADRKAAAQLAAAEEAAAEQAAAEAAAVQLAAAEQAAAEQAAAEMAAAEKIASEKAAEEKRAVEEFAAAEKTALEKAARERAAAEEAAAEEAAAEKAEAEKASAEKAAADKVAVEKAAAEEAASEQAAVEKAATEKVAAEKAAAEKRAAEELVAAEKVAVEKAAVERAAAEEAAEQAAEQAAEAKAAAEMVAAEKVAAERKAAEEVAAAEKAAVKRASVERAAAEEAAEQAAAEKAAAEKAVAEKAAAERKAAEEVAAAENDAVEEAAVRRAAAEEVAAAQAAAEKVAAEKVAAQKAAAERNASEEVAAAEKAAVEKASAGKMAEAEDWLLPGKWSMNLVRTNPEAVSARRKGQVSDTVKSLPAWETRDEILTSIRTSQVTIISGDPGCGKSTLIPQLIADATNLIEDDMVVLCAQPQHIAAVSLAQYVAQDRGQDVGDEVGYQIPFVNAFSEHTRLIYATTAMLLRRLHSEQTLDSIGCLIIDEVQERDVLTDSLLLLIREAMRGGRMRHLKVVLMSSAAKADDFADYFQDVNGDLPLRPVLVAGRRHPVDLYFWEDACQWLRFCPSFPEVTGKGRNKCGDVERQQPDGEDLWKIHDAIASCDLVPDRPGKARADEYGETVLRACWAWRENQIYIDVIVDLVLLFHQDKPKGDGAVLVFLPGCDDIIKVFDRLYNTGEDLKVIMLHSLTTAEQQQEAFGLPPDGSTKIILSTDVAEASVTIDDVVYVIDCGVCEERVYDPDVAISALDTNMVTRASAIQRRARAGRMQEGLAVHLFPSYKFDSLEEFSVPKIFTSSMDEAVLQSKVICGGSITSISRMLQDCIAAPAPKAVSAAISSLQSMDCLTRAEGELTALGQACAAIPVAPSIAKMLLLAGAFRCIRPAAVVAAFLSLRSPFREYVGSDEVKVKIPGNAHFNKGFHSDHITVLQAYNEWRLNVERGRGDKFLDEQGLSPDTMKSAHAMVHQFVHFIQGADYDGIDVLDGPYAGIDPIKCGSNTDVLLRCVLTGAFWPRAAVLRQGEGAPAWCTGLDVELSPVRGSVNADYQMGGKDGEDWMVYSDAINMGAPKPQVLQSTLVASPLVLLFAHSLHLDQEAGQVHFDVWEATVDLQQPFWEQLLELRALVMPAFQKAIESRNLSLFPEEITARMVAFAKIKSSEFQLSNVKARIIPVANDVSTAVLQAPHERFDHQQDRSATPTSRGNAIPDLPVKEGLVLAQEVKEFGASAKKSTAFFDVLPKAVPCEKPQGEGCEKITQPCIPSKRKSKGGGA